MAGATLPSSGTRAARTKGSILPRPSPGGRLARVCPAFPTSLPWAPSAGGGAVPGVCRLSPGPGGLRRLQRRGWARWGQRGFAGRSGQRTGNLRGKCSCGSGVWLGGRWARRMELCVPALSTNLGERRAPACVPPPGAFLSPASPGWGRPCGWVRGPGDPRGGEFQECGFGFRFQGCALGAGCWVLGGETGGEGTGG